MSYSAMYMGLELNVLVSTTSAPDLKIGSVNVLDYVGTAKYKDVVVAFLAPEVIHAEVRSWTFVPMAPS